MVVQERDLIAIPGEEYITSHDSYGYYEPTIMKKYEQSWFPFSRTHLAEVRYHSSNFLDLGRKWRNIGYLAIGKPLLFDTLMLPFTAFYKLKNRLTR